MLNKVEASEFNKIIQASISCDAKYLAVTEINTGLKPVFYIFTNNNEVTIGFALFERKNRIVMPKQLLFYSGIWIKGGLHDDDFNNHFFEAIAQLKKKYTSITLVTAPEITDLRPFLWNNFQAELRYTYCKASDDNNYSERIFRYYKRALKKIGLFHTVCSFNDLDWKGYNDLFKTLHYSTKQIIHIKNWLSELDKNNFLWCLQINNAQMQCAGSGIVLLDKVLKKGYFIYMDINKNQHSSETNAYIYIEIQKWLLENGYDELDYLGANFKTIANYKSRFYPKLKPYYVVHYNRYNLNIMTYFKMLIKKIIAT